MSPHQISVYQKDDRLYVAASLPSRTGMQILADVQIIPDGWEGLLPAMERAEALALSESAKKPAARQMGDANTLPTAAGCKSFAQFVRGTVGCVMVRTPDYVLVMRQVEDAEQGVLVGTPRQQKLPAKASLELLARHARTVIEGQEGGWTT